MLTDARVEKCVGEARSFHDNGRLARAAVKRSNEAAVNAALGSSLLPPVSQLPRLPRIAMALIAPESYDSDFSTVKAREFERLSLAQVSDGIGRLRQFLDVVTARETRIDMALAREGVAPLSTLPRTLRSCFEMKLFGMKLPTTEELTAAASRVAAQARRERGVLPMPQALQPVPLDSLPRFPQSVNPPPWPPAGARWARCRGCGNSAGYDCANEMCGRCCPGMCPRHGGGWR